MTSQLKRLMSVSLSVDWTTAKFKSSLGHNAPMLKTLHRFRRRRLLRFLAFLGIVVLVVIHLFPGMLEFYATDDADATHEGNHDNSFYIECTADASYTFISNCYFHRCVKVK